MSNNELAVFLVLVVIAFFSAMIVFSSRHVKIIEAAREIISRGNRAEFHRSHMTNNCCFRKSRLLVLLNVVLFLLLTFAAHENISQHPRSEEMNVIVRLILEVCVLGLPLVLAVHQGNYRVCFFADYMRIHSFGTQTLWFEQMETLRLETVKSSVFCVIEMKDGRRISVGSGLADFLSFVELLSERQFRTVSSVRS